MCISLAHVHTNRVLCYCLGENGCSEGSVTVVRDSDNSSLQLMEMCHSEGVWSPLCDTNWTPQDTTVVCREASRGISKCCVIVAQSSFKI